MLSDIGDNDQLLKYPVDGFDDVLRSQIRLLFHHEWMLAFPCIDFIQPLFCIIFMHIFQHFIDCFSGIRNNRDVYLYIFRDRGSININMHYFGIGCKGMQLSRDSVIESRTDGKQQIALIYGHITGIGTMHSDIPHIQRVIAWNCPLPHNCCYDRYIRFINQLCKVLICMGNIHTAPGKKQWTFCLSQHFDSTLQLTDMHCSIGLISPNIHLIRIICFSQLSHNILWKIDQHRTGSSACRYIKGFFDNTSQVFPSANRDTVFSDTAGDSHNIHLLKRIISD